MNKKILIPVIAFSMLLLMVAPIMAGRTKTPYTLGLVGWSVDPGTWVLRANKIMHNRGGTGAQNIYGSPWGDGTSESTGIQNNNIIDITGSGMGHVVDTYATGTIEGILNYKITGLGLYTYEGPAFTYEGVNVEAGDTFFGFLFSGIVVKHGTSGELEGLQTRGTFMGVQLIDTSEIPFPVPTNPTELIGKNLVYETGTYW